jgi:Peptidase family C25
MTEPSLYFNGIDGETGEYVLPPATPEELSALARRGSPAAEDLVDAQFWLRQGRKSLRSGDPCDLAQAGWGVIFAANDPQDELLYAALRPLLDLRRSQAGRIREHYYRELRGNRGYQPGDTKRRFLSRHGVGPGAADPDRMPYYLLIVGDPETIPYEFQYQLDMQYAVGRIWFETIAEYAEYAANVVAAETSPRPRKRTAAFFAPQHPGDAGTELSATHLASPLAAHAAKNQEWTVRSIIGAEATKACLRSLLEGDEVPDLLFTAGHGMVFKNGHPLQEKMQGALLCGDWPGPVGWHGSLPPDFYLSAADINGSARIQGMITFHFACYSAGGPAWDDFSTAHERHAVAPKSFIAHLPTRLLQAGVLAVIGHVEKAWFCSIDWPGAGAQIQAFEDTIDRLFSGHPVGSAMEPFGQRYAELSSDLSAGLEEAWRGTPEDALQLADLWINSHDARNYVVLGDPAVRLVRPEDVS